MLTEQQARAIRQLEVWVAGATLSLSTIGLLIALYQAYSGQATKGAVGLFFSFSLLTGLAITVGYHRYFAHRSFQASIVMQYILGAIAGMACQGPLFFWVTYHRKHHRFPDQAEDVHSPQHGFFHAHMGWLLTHTVENRKRYISDLVSDKVAQRIDGYYPGFILIGLLLPMLLGGWLIGGAQGYWQGFIWGGLARIAVVHHMTWCVNSFGHYWGKQDFATGDASRNNFWVALITLGEGWHNNHHADPRSARHGLTWWQIDISYLVILLLEKLRLIYAIVRHPR